MEPISQYKVDRLLYFLKDDKLALLFCLDLLYIGHTWDSLIDKDEIVTPEDINQAFIKCLALIPNNPFYAQCQPALLPMMYNCLTMWLESNELRKGNRDQKITAFSIGNDGIIQIIHFCIVLKGTAEWAREVSEEFWQLFGPTQEELDEFLGVDNAE